MSVILLNYKLKVVKIIACYQVGKTTWYHCTTCGRRFYSCPKTSGCQFFKWDSPENNLGQSPAFKPPRQAIMK